MALPTFVFTDSTMSRLQTSWKSQLDPILAAPTPLTLRQVSLKAGHNVINHLLGRTLQGWSIVRQRASSSVYDTQDTNQMPELTLYLTASADVVVDIQVF